MHATATSGPSRPFIPETVLEKPPSAELRPDQKDTDSLPEYEELDPIIEGYVEDDRSIAELVADGLDPDTVRARRPAGRPQRVQAAPGAPRRARVAEGVRQGPPSPDHQPLAGLATDAGAARTCGDSPPRARWSRAAFLFGITFPLVHDALDDVTPFAYLRASVRDR